jgi:hypothetical protein
MDKNNTIHLEEAMSPYATPFVENKELEKRYAATSWQGSGKECG